MRPGPAPKPTALRILEGNRSRRPLPRGEPQPERTAPVCPDWLHDYAKEHWAYLAPRLEMGGLLADVDLGSFAGLCESWATYRVASEFVTKHGPIYKTPAGYLAQVPQVSMARAALGNYIRLATEFGLTASARTRIDLSGHDDAQDDVLEA